MAKQDAQRRGQVASTADGLRDVSVAFDIATPAWPGDTPFTCGWPMAMATGASVNVSRWETSPHVGTHADAPLHVSANGAGADQLPIAPFLGPAIVVGVAPDAGPLSLMDLERAGFRAGGPRLLLRTSCSTAGGRFPDHWPTLAPDTAHALTAAGLVLLGVDAPSVDARESKDLAVHHALFDGGAYVLENLDLRNIAPGPWELVALPLRTGPVDAAPVRAFLRPLSTLLMLVVALSAGCRASVPATPPAPTVQPGVPGAPGRVLGAEQTERLARPPHTAADVAFMQGMIAHHEQALAMTALVRTRTSSRDIQLVSLRIELSQQDEINLMRAWLRQRGEPVPGEGEHAAHDMGDDHLMPGMLTRAEMAALAAVRDAEFDKRFLAGMIKHHEGAVRMVAELFASIGGGQQSDIYQFASDVDADQQMEISRMQALLAARP